MMKLFNYLYYVNYSTLKDHPYRDAKTGGLDLPTIVFACIITNVNAFLYVYYIRIESKIYIYLIFFGSGLLAYFLFNKLYKKSDFYKNIEEYFLINGKVKNSSWKYGLLVMFSIILGTLSLILSANYGHTLLSE